MKPSHPFNTKSKLLICLKILILDIYNYIKGIMTDENKNKDVIRIEII